MVDFYLNSYQGTGRGRFGRVGLLELRNKLCLAGTWARSHQFNHSDNFFKVNIPNSQQGSTPKHHHN